MELDRCGFENLQKPPTRILPDVDHDLCSTIVHIWNFLHQQRDILELENAPRLDTCVDDTIDDADEIKKEENKKRMHMDTSFKSIMVYIYHIPFYSNSLAMRLTTLFLYNLFNCSEHKNKIHYVDVLENVSVNRFTIPTLYYIITNNKEYLQYNDISELPHRLLINGIYFLIKDYLTSPLGIKTIKKVPNTIHSRTRVMGIDHNGNEYYLLNGYLFSISNNKWYLFHTTSQIDDILDYFQNEPRDNDISTQINNLRKYIKVDRRAAQEFGVGRKAKATSSHFLSFSPIKKHLFFDNETANCLKQIIKDFAKILSNVSWLLEKETSPSLLEQKKSDYITLVPIMEESSDDIISSDNDSKQLSSEHSSGSDESMSEENSEENSDESSEGSSNESSNENTSGEEEESSNESEEGDSDDNDDNESEEEGESMSEEDNQGSEKDHKKQSKKSKEDKIKQKAKGKSPHALKEFKIEHYDPNIKIDEQDGYETLNNEELSELLDFLIDEVSTFPILTQANYQMITKELIQFIGTLSGALPTKYFKKGYVFIRDFIVFHSTETQTVSMLQVMITLLERGVRQ